MLAHINALPITESRTASQWTYSLPYFVSPPKNIKSLNRKVKYQIVSAPPEITVEKSWVHAAEGYDVELVCIVHGDVNSEVSF